MTSDLFDCFNVDKGTPATFRPGSGPWTVVDFLRRHCWAVSGILINRAGLALSFRSRVSDIRKRVGTSDCIVNTQGTGRDERERAKRTTLYYVPAAFQDVLSALAPEETPTT